ncbi:prepilin-type N-terminal cleavage/methylation domain-containing protein [Synechocystis salina LEGE 06155]|nr:prepilin-type N-terminal cleavage/methylation domain-containing protein [Synechocystis salina LEGE 06155]
MSGKTTMFRFQNLLRSPPQIGESSLGFTILELMIVVMIMGVLSSIALPSLIRQVGKARESEANQVLSSIAFAQQGYFFENREFSDNYVDLGVGISPANYDFPDPETIPGTFRTKSQAISRDNGLTGSRDYAIGVYYDNNAHTYIIVLCQAANVGIATQVPDSSAGTCTNGGVRIY